MTYFGTQLTALIAVAGFTAGGAVGADPATPDGQSKRTALVIDAAEARDGRELVDPRLREVDADVRLPRTAVEARTNVRYFEALGYRVVVAGPQARAVAKHAGIDAATASGLTGALQAAGG
jgi:hypothetical protein